MSTPTTNGTVRSVDTLDSFFEVANTALDQFLMKRQENPVEVSDLEDINKVIAALDQLIQKRQEMLKIQENPVDTPVQNIVEDSAVDQLIQNCLENEGIIQNLVPGNPLFSRIQLILLNLSLDELAKTL